MIDLLKDLTESLHKLNIPYMLSGSLAMNLYTVPRMTRDIDIVVHLQEKDVEKFIGAFKERFYCHPESVLEEVKRQGMFNLIDNATGYKVDFIVRKNSPYRKLEFDRKVKTNVFGFEAYVVSIEDLILSKLIWIQTLQSDKQLEDLNNLLKNPEIDFVYLKKWVENLSLHTFNLL